MRTLIPTGTGRLGSILALGLALWAAGEAGQAVADDPPASLQPASAPSDSGCDCCDKIPIECCAPAPRDPWYVNTDGIALQRVFRGIGPVATQGLGEFAPYALTHQDLLEPYAGGAQLTVGHTFGDSPYQIEVSYFWLGPSDTSARVTDPNNDLFSLFTQFGVPPDTRVDFNNLVDIHEVSHLESGDINLKCILPMPAGDPTIMLMFGLRHVGLREEFDYASQPTKNVNPVSVESRTNNNLWGPQIGGLIDVGRQDVWLHVEGKIAICDNEASRDLDAKIDGSDASHPRLSQSGTAMIGDVSASVQWRPTSALTAKVGYQALWADQMVLAARNFSTDVSDLTNPAAEPPLNRRGTVVYQGPFAGLQLSW